MNPLDQTRRATDTAPWAEPSPSQTPQDPRIVPSAEQRTAASRDLMSLAAHPAPALNARVNRQALSPLINRRTDGGPPGVDLPANLTQHIGSFLPGADIYALWTSRKRNEPVPTQLLAQPMRALSVAQQEVARERLGFDSLQRKPQDAAATNAAQRKWAKAARKLQELKAQVQRWKTLAAGERSERSRKFTAQAGERAAEAMRAFHTTGAVPGAFEAFDDPAMAEYMEGCEELMKLGQYADAQALGRRVLESGSLEGNDREDFEDVFAESSLQSSLEGAVHAENFVRQLLARSSEAWRTQTLEAALARALLRQGRAQEAIEAQSEPSAARIPGPRIMALQSSCRFEEAETQFNYWILGRQAPGRPDFIGETGRTVQGNGPQRLDWEVPLIERLCSRMETGAWLNKDRLFFNSAASLLETGMTADLACFSYFVKPVQESALWPMFLRCQGLDQPLPPPLVNPASARVQ